VFALPAVEEGFDEDLLSDFDLLAGGGGTLLRSI